MGTEQMTDRFQYVWKPLKMYDDWKVDRRGYQGWVRGGRLHGGGGVVYICGLCPIGTYRAPGEVRCSQKATYSTMGKRYGTAEPLIADADHTVEMDMRQLPFVLKVGDFRQGTSTTGNAVLRAGGRGALWAATDPEVIAYGKTLWELSK